MIPVFQTETTPGKGNCMSACLASVLEMPIEKVPNFRLDNLREEFNEAINNWLHRYALVMVRIQKRDSDDEEIDYPFFPLRQKILCIGSGKSPRGDFGHSVVGEIEWGCHFKMLHDPHPAGVGIERLWTIDLLVPRDPAKTITRVQVGD